MAELIFYLAGGMSIAMLALAFIKAVVRKR